MNPHFISLIAAAGLSVPVVFAAVTVPGAVVVLLVLMTGLGVWGTMTWWRIRASRQRLLARNELVMTDKLDTTMAPAARMGLKSPATARVISTSAHPPAKLVTTGTDCL